MVGRDVEHERDSGVRRSSVGILYIFIYPRKDLLSEIYYYYVIKSHTLLSTLFNLSKIFMIGPYSTLSFLCSI